MKYKRVVVTGLGVISSLGEDLEDFWDNCLKGTSGVTPINIDNNGYRLVANKIGGQVHNFDPHNYIEKNNVKDIGRGSHLLIACMKQAIKDSKLKLEEYTDGNLYVGTTMGEISGQESHLNFRHNIETNPTVLDQNNLHTILVNAAREFELKGRTSLITNACASGNYALIPAYENIKNGKCKVAFVAGVDPFSVVAYYGFNRLNAIASSECSPFDKNRKGIIVSEGAACLILEEFEHAKKRNATIYAEVAGYGASTDAYHITSPHPESEGMFRCMKNAIESSNINLDDIDYISAHGTGTPANDRLEGSAINKLFGTEVPVSSIKSMLGHSMGAASAIESVVCCLAIRDQIAPPTINFKSKDEEFNIDCIPNKSRELKIKYALNNSAAFGGMNASVVFKKI